MSVPCTSHIVAITAFVLGAVRRHAWATACEAPSKCKQSTAARPDMAGQATLPAPCKVPALRQVAERTTRLAAERQRQMELDAKMEVERQKALVAQEVREAAQVVCHLAGKHLLCRQTMLPSSCHP